MLHDEGLQLNFWDEACNTFVCLQNISPHQILGMITPEEVFSGKKLDVAHFRIFVSLVYWHVTKDVRKNLEPTTVLGIFVGYIDSTHNYRVYLPSKMMTVVHRDVNFYEEKPVRCSLEREIHLHADEELLALKEEPQDDVDQPHA